MKIFFAVSANSKIGYGHLKRCLLIGREFLLKRITPVFFIFEVNDKNILSLIEKEGFEYIIIKEPFYADSYIKRFNTTDKNLLIIDSDNKRLYAENFQKEIVENYAQLMYITLYNNFHYYSHYILNPNIISLSQKYSTESYTKRLLGPDYFILENKLKNIKPNEFSAKDEGINLLITFGSADPANITDKVLDLLENKIEMFNKIRIVLGGLNSKIEEIKSHFLVQKHAAKFELYINTNKMYELMAQTDLAITSVGLTFWELLLHKVPSFVISGSEREKDVLNYFKEKGYCFFIGHYDDKNWHKDWNDKLNFYLKKNTFMNVNTEKLYQTVNVNGKTKLVNTILKNYE